jgi:hypothetical protein
MARYKQQLNGAMDRLDQGLARLQGFIKRGENGAALRFMDDELRELYTEVQDLINIEPSDSSKVGFLE